MALPPLGAGNGGLDWAEVKPLILNALVEIPDVEVELYEPASARRAILGKAVPMSHSRAALLALLREYVTRRQAVDPWEHPHGASHLEIQKLMYFADQAEPTLRLRFDQGNYGPYSDVVRIMISEMEGWYLEGHGDGTSRVLDLNPIGVTAQGDADLDAYLATDEGQAVRARVVDPVLHIIEGFESPFTLELLASVHWAALRSGNANVDSVHDYIASWSDRKQRLFDRQQVDVALTQLAG